MAKRSTRSRYEYGFDGHGSSRFPSKMTVGERQVRATLEAGKLSKDQRLDPVVLRGQTIAHTFWGKAFCDHLGRFAHLSNRLARGRSYVRSGSVVHLEIEAGVVRAKVSGSALYDVELRMTPTPKKHWAAVTAACVGHIASLVELLAGRFDEATMGKLVAPDSGLLPGEGEMTFTCSCPDGRGGGGKWVCKHVAATMFGVGARLDRSPGLLFTLRGVDPSDLLAAVGTSSMTAPAGKRGRATVAEADLGDVFGIELALPDGERQKTARSAQPPKTRPAKAAQIAKKKPGAKKTSVGPKSVGPKSAAPKSVAPVTRAVVAKKGGRKSAEARRTATLRRVPLPRARR